jgi:VWFA-related protein
MSSFPQQTRPKQAPARLAKLLVCGVFLLTPFAPGQDATASNAEETAQTEKLPDSFKLDVALVNVDVLVTDEDGKVLSGLKAENFRILDNGVPQAIESFAPTSAPITVVILMEASGAAYGYFTAKGAEWASSFLDHLDEKDWVALVTYDLRSTVRVDFTHQRYKVRDALSALGPTSFNEANLYDALTDTLDKLDGIKGRKSILLLSTGNNSLSEATMDEVRARLRRTDTVLFCVGLAEAEFLRWRGTDSSYLQQKNALTSFSRQTGGIALFPRFDGELPSIFSTVVGFLRNEYTLTFRLPQERRDGRFHRLKVEVVGPAGKPLVVTNEKGKQRRVKVFAREGYTATAGQAQ